MLRLKFYLNYTMLYLSSPAVWYHCVCGSTYKLYLQKLVSLQNKGLRLITNNFTFHQPFVSESLLHKQK